MNRENKEAVTARETAQQAAWQRPELRRIEAGMAEGSRGTGPVDVVFAS
ncbi:MAG: hypothetical protein WBR13_05020 [Allosphingosinicella sp.]